MIGIRTPITWSMDYELIGERNERLIHLCSQAGASEYLSGPAAKSYLDESLFLEHGISVHWMDYRGYPEYGQQYTPPFLHQVSVVDLILNEGAERAKEFMLSFGSASADRTGDARP